MQPLPQPRRGEGSNMALFVKQVESLRVENLKDLHANRERLETAILELEAELGQLHSVDEGERALDAFLAGAPRPFPARISTVERQLADLKAARVALCGRIRKAIIDLGKARAAVPRARAKKLQAELDK